MPETDTMPAYEERVEVRLGERLEAYFVHFDIKCKGTTLVDHERGTYEVTEEPSVTIRELYDATAMNDIDILPTLSAEDRMTVNRALLDWIENNIDPSDAEFYEQLDELTGDEL